MEIGLLRVIEDMAWAEREAGKEGKMGGTTVEACHLVLEVSSLIDYTNQPLVNPCVYPVPSSCCRCI